MPDENRKVMLVGYGNVDDRVSGNNPKHLGVYTDSASLKVAARRQVDQHDYYLEYQNADGVAFEGREDAVAFLDAESD